MLPLVDAFSTALFQRKYVLAGRSRHISQNAEVTPDRAQTGEDLQFKKKRLIDATHTHTEKTLNVIQL